MFEKAMKWLNVLVLLIELNILWLLGLILGLFFIGLVPSTSAMVRLFEKSDLFTGYYSYVGVFKLYCHYYVETIKTYKWRVLLFPIVVSTIYLELLFIQKDQMMRAVFQWPLLILLAYVLLVLINSILIDDRSTEIWWKKAVFALMSPLVLIGESIICILLILTFAIISLAYHWFFFIAISLFVYTTYRCLYNGYQKKGLLKI
jgi:uncharacterized membrane protein YesL